MTKMYDGSAIFKAQKETIPYSFLKKMNYSSELRIEIQMCFNLTNFMMRFELDLP